MISRLLLPVSVELLDETERKYIQTLFPAHNTASKPKRLTAHEIRREEMKSAALEIIHQKFSALKISRKFPRKQRKINADGKSG